MAFLEAFSNRPATHSLIQLGEDDDSSDSDDSSDDDGKDSGSDGDLDDDDDDEDVQFTQLYTTTGEVIRISDDMEVTSNAVDSGKLSGFIEIIYSVLALSKPIFKAGPKPAS